MDHLEYATDFVDDANMRGPLSRDAEVLHLAAIAHALIALVERLDRMTDTGSDINGDPIANLRVGLLE